MHGFLFNFNVVTNSVLFWKLLVFGFLLGTSETLLCSMSAPQVKIFPLLDSLQLLMFAGTMTYLEPKLFLLIIFYNGSFYILKYSLYATCMYRIQIFSHPLLAGAIRLLHFYYCPSCHDLSLFVYMFV
jgi:hypothetical protein